MERRLRRRLLRLNPTLDKTGLTRTKVYEGLNDKTFPLPVKIGNTVAWVEDELDDWIEQRIRERDIAWGIARTSEEAPPKRPRGRPRKSPAGAEV